MDKIEELKNIVADWFSAAETKTEIERATAIKNKLEEVEAEHLSLKNENKDLLKDYKELVSHTSFNDSRNRPTDNIGTTSISFEEALQNFIANKK